MLAQTIPKGHQVVKAEKQPRGSFGSDIKYSPDGRILAAVSFFGFGEVMLYDTKSEETLENFANPKWVTTIAFRPDSKILATGHHDGTVQLWDTGDIDQGIGLRDRLGEAGILSGHKATVNSIAYSPDGKWMASGSQDKTVRLLDANTGEHIRTLSGHRGAVYSVAFRPDSKILAAASWGSVYLWETNTGRKLRELDQRPIVKADTPHIYTVAFSPDGNTIVTGGFYGTLFLWDVDTGRRLRRFNQTPKVRIEMASLYRVAFSPDGNTIAGTNFGHIYLWDANTTREPKILSRQGFSSSVTFSPDGKRVASIGQSEIIMWDTITGQRIYTKMYIGY